MFLKGIVK